MIDRELRLRKIRILVGHQKQADKPIYLLATGAILCGRFRYEGRDKKDFKELHEKILSLTRIRPQHDVLDVSHYQYWDAVRIYHEYMAAQWRRSIGAKKMEQFAIETEVFMLLEPVRAEFKRAVGAKWRKQFMNADLSDPNVPRKAWQIL